jgi:uncharacterized protein YwqG
VPPSLPGWEGQRLWCPEAYDLAAELNADQPWTAYQQAVQDIIGEQPEITSCVGGYPRWIQGEETPKKMSFLAQIDSEEEKAGIMWGDVGSVYLFLLPNRPHTIRMVFQCC